MGIEKGLTDARSHPSVLQDGLFRVRLFRLVFSGSFFDQLLQFTTLIHFDHDITTAHQLAVNPQLREGRPVRIFRQFRTNVRILQNINIGKTFATCGKRPTARQRNRSSAVSVNLSCTAGSGFQQSGVGFFDSGAHCLASSNFFTAVI